MGRSNRRKKKWITHYSDSHYILLVGEGNFSFSVALATALGSATNMVATSLDSKSNSLFQSFSAFFNLFLSTIFIAISIYTLLKKYSSTIETTLEELEEMDCEVMHGVNVMTMDQHPLLPHNSFDRIIFNFPHAGFQYSTEHEPNQIKLHQNLVRRFMRNATELLAENGEIHITHKTSYPYSEWKIEEIGEEEGLYLKEEVEFDKRDYPGYVNKKGSGPNSNKNFPVGSSSTFKFVKSLSKKEMNRRLALSTSLASEFTQLQV
ncbi:hypothetical protein IC582_001267 [Cucumis melo]